MFKYQDLKLFGLILNQYNVSNFQPLELVGRGSETQAQIGENLNEETCGQLVIRPSLESCFMTVTSNKVKLCLTHLKL